MGWTIKGNADKPIKLNITITYSIPKAVSNVKRNPFIGLKIQNIAWPLEMLLATSSDDPEQVRVLTRVECALTSTVYLVGSRMLLGSPARQLVRERLPTASILSVR